jgi:hypothetical protein
MANITTKANNILGYKTSIYNPIHNKEFYQEMILQKNKVDIGLPIELQRNIFKYLADENEMLVVFYQDHIDIIDIQTGHMINRINKIIMYYNNCHICISPDGSRIIVANKYNDKYIFDIFDILSGSLLGIVESRSIVDFSFINEIKCSPDNKKLYIFFYKDPNLHLFCFDIEQNVNEGKTTENKLFNFCFYPGVSKVFLSPNSKIMCIYHNMIRQIEIYNALTGELLNTIENMNGHVIKFYDNDNLIIHTFSDNVEEYMAHQNVYLDYIKFNINIQERNIIDKVEMHSPKYIQYIESYESKQVNRWSKERNIYTIEYNSNITVYPNGEINKTTRGKKHIEGKIKYSKSKKYVIHYNDIFFEIFKLN